MARNRMLKAEIWANEDFQDLTDTAKIFYLGSHNFADDNGRFRRNPGYLNSCLYPYGGCTTEDADKAIDQVLAQGGLWTAYIAKEDGREYIQIKNWKKWQTINRPSTHNLCPAPSADGIASVPENPSTPGKFVDFWKEYPKKSQQSLTFGVWCEIEPDDALADKIIESVKQHRQTKAWANRQYIPSPVNFLSRRMWETEFEAEDLDGSAQTLEQRVEEKRKRRKNS